MKPVAGACLLLSVALALVSSPGRLRSAVTWNETHAQSDFGVFYETARCLATRACDPYPPDVETPNLNPPHAHVALLPLLAASRETAYWIWLVCSAAALALTGWRFWRAGLWPGPNWAFIVLAGFMLLSAPAHLTISTGQIYAVLGYPLSEAWLAVRSGRWRVAGAILAVLATIKPILLLPLVWVFWQSPRSVVRGVALACLIVAAGVASFGLQSYSDWIGHSLLADRFLGSPIDGSLLQTAHRSFSITAYFPAPVVEAPWIITPLWLTASGLLLIDLFLWHSSASVNRTWLGLITAMLLMSPKGWIYAGWWVMFPALAVWWEDDRKTSFLLLGAAGLMAVEAISRVTTAPWLVPLTGSVYFWAWMSLYMGARHSQNPVTTPLVQ